MTKKYNFKVSNFILSKYIERKDTINMLDLSSFNITSLVPLPELNIEKIILPDTIKELKDYAFYNCTLLDSIILGSGITSIGIRAFSGCTSLKSIIIPDSVTSIGDFAFYGCSSLTNITLSKSIKKLIRGTFTDCSSLEYIEIPDSVTELGYTYETGSLHYGTFEECGKLKRIKLSNNIQTLHDFTFSGCSSLEYLIIPESVTKIESSCFRRVNLNIILYFEAENTDNMILEDDWNVISSSGLVGENKKYAKYYIGKGITWDLDENNEPYLL